MAFYVVWQKVIKTININISSTAQPQSCDHIDKCLRFLQNLWKNNNPPASQSKVLKLLTSSFNLRSKNQYRSGFFYQNRMQTLLMRGETEYISKILS